VCCFGARQGAGGLGGVGGRDACTFLRYLGTLINLASYRAKACFPMRLVGRRCSGASLIPGLRPATRGWVRGAVAI